MGSRGALVTLREIDADTVRAICALRVTPRRSTWWRTTRFRLRRRISSPRRGFVRFTRTTNPSASRCCTTPRMRRRPSVRDTCHLWRFMIAAPHQHRGYGGAALAQLIGHVRTLAGVTMFALSFVPADGDPRDFYARFGFRETGEVDDGEVVMELGLSLATEAIPGR